MKFDATAASKGTLLRQSKTCLAVKVSSEVINQACHAKELSDLLHELTKSPQIVDLAAVAEELGVGFATTRTGNSHVTQL